jgi:hypothetical protein
MPLAQNVTQNMAEDATYLIGYSLVNKFLSDLLASEFPDELDDQGRPTINLAKELLSGGASYLLMSGMMEIIKREEQFITYLFSAGEAVIVILWARHKAKFNGIIDSIKGRKGVKATNRLGLLAPQAEEQNTFINQVYQAMQAIMQGRSASQDVAQTIGASNSTQQVALSREDQNLKFANANNQAFNNSMLIKTMTGSFTQTDEIILKKVIGRSNFATTPLSIDELNTVHEFMLVKDSSGKFMGLTQAFTTLLNGLGYIHK